MSPLKIVALLTLVSMMLETGIQMQPSRVIGALKNYNLIGRALLINFILVPLYGFAVLRLLPVPPAVAAGVLLMAIAPGLPLLPRRGGTKVGGSLDFAVTLTFLLPAISVITVPLTARFLLPPGFAADVPVASFMITLFVFQLLPLIAGAVLAKAAPAFAKGLERPLAAVFAICALAFVALIAPTLYKAVTAIYGSFGMLAALCIVLLSFATGWLFGGATTEHRNTLAVGSALRNVGLAATIATANFPGSLVTAGVAGYFIVQLLTAVLLGAFMKPAARVPKATTAPSS